MKTILQKVQDDGKTINAACNGNHTCGKCKIRVYNQELPIVKKEREFLTKKELDMGIRLACFHPYNSQLTYDVLDTKMEILEDMVTNQTFTFIKREESDVIIDIGTTTIVMKWIDCSDGHIIATESFRNPQADFGSDVITRIQYDTEHPYILHRCLIRELEKQLLKYQNIIITKMVICGNTTMTHLFLDVPTKSLGQIPFTVIKKQIQYLSSQTIFPTIKNIFEIITFPHVSAFVGGDIVAGIVASDMDQSKSNNMMIDLGTNGEIVVGNYNCLLSTSTAAGPAFEGVGIQCGGPSIPGAITKVTIEDGKLQYQTIENLEPTCICGSGLISLLATLIKHSIIDELGSFTQGIKKFYITDTIYITMQDIQKFQLAKAAIQAGITILLKEIENIDTLYISGGFGSSLDIEDLITIKLIPKEYTNKIKNMKNSAISGVYTTLLTNDYQRLESIIRKTKNINLAKNPDFEDLLVDGLYF